MDSKLSKRNITLTIIASLLVLSGCELLGKQWHPSDYIYLDKNTIKNSMRQLAISMDNIDRLLEKVNSDSVVGTRDNIIIELDNIEAIAKDLGAGKATTNHVFIDQNIDQFHSDVTQARDSVESQPPNYYLTGKLVGSCVSCHIQRPDKHILMKFD